MVCVQSIAHLNANVKMSEWQLLALNWTRILMRRTQRYSKCVRKILQVDRLNIYCVYALTKSHRRMTNDIY